MDDTSASQPTERLDAWLDGPAICVIAVSAHGDPLDAAELEVEAFAWVTAKVRILPNPSLQPTCYGWLRQPPQAAELKR